MITVAGIPILRHIIDGFVAQGFREFIVLTGHLHEMIDSYFGYFGRLVAPWLYRCDPIAPGVTVRTLYTGSESHTGERLLQAREAIAGRDFVLTYGDGLCDVDMRKLIEVHRHEQPHLGPTVTVTAVNPPGRFGVIDMEPGSGFPYFRQARSFDEKPRTDQWINGGFMFVENSFIDEYVRDGRELESEALSDAARAGDLCAYLHREFWMCMDTRRDLERIEAAVAAAGRLPWLLTDTQSDRMKP